MEFRGSRAFSILDYEPFTGRPVAVRGRAAGRLLEASRLICQQEPTSGQGRTGEAEAGRARRRGKFFCFMFVSLLRFVPPIARIVKLLSGPREEGCVGHALRPRRHEGRDLARNGTRRPTRTAWLSV